MDPPFKKHKNFKGSRSRLSEFRNPDYDRNRSAVPKHPPHLRGREIGMYYAELRKKNLAEGTASPLIKAGSILLSQKEKDEIDTLLSSSNLWSKTDQDGTYDHVEDSTFKRDFLRVLRGNIEGQSVETEEMKRDEKLDSYLYEQLELRKDHNKKYMHMLENRKKLPSFDKRDDILKMVAENQIVVISGETGCGKTTQVAQFILDDYIEKKSGSMCHIVCTQPRRISAISVAERVAEERGENLGISVGYQIRLEKKLPRDRGSIIFCTTGVVLKQMESDFYLNKVTHLILDEIHERNVTSDFLITLVKRLHIKRPDLKLILMSATLNSEQFSKYFDSCPLLHIPGFTYPVVEHFLEDVLDRTGFKFESKEGRGGHSRRDLTDYSKFIEPYIRQLERDKSYSNHVYDQLRNLACEMIDLDLVYELVLDICCKEREGAILIFLTGYAEISALSKKMEQSGKFPRSKYIIIPLHSQMPSVEQKMVFKKPPHSIRKIVIATNIAETSITIDDVVFVIDCGKIKMTNYEPESNTQTLQPEWISVANANQRRGRAGRVREGVCFHLISKYRYNSLEQYQKPEILRTRLENVILDLKVLQLGKAEEFLSSLMDPPDSKVVETSIELLKRLDALDSGENLTPLGYHLAKLPISPQMGKIILLGAIFGCLDPVLSVAASLDFKDAFQMPLGKEKLVDEKKIELAQGWSSDHMILHEALNRFEKKSAEEARKFCWEYFLSYHTMTLLSSMKEQFMGHLHEMNFVASKDPHCEVSNRNSGNVSLVKAVICAGLYPNVALVRYNKRGRCNVMTTDRKKVSLHPKSVVDKLGKIEAPMLVYYIKLKTAFDYIHDATAVHPLPVLFFGDQFKFVDSDAGYKNISIGGKLLFKCTKNTALTIRTLRDRLNWFLEHKISHPGVVDWTGDGDDIKLLSAIIKLITNEDVGDLDLDAYDDFD